MSEIDEYGTDRASLVPADLEPEPAGYSEPDEADDEAVQAPEADESGPLLDEGDDELDDEDLNDAADLDFLRRGGDRG